MSDAAGSHDPAYSPELATGGGSPVIGWGLTGTTKMSTQRPSPARMKSIMEASQDFLAACRKGQEQKFSVAGEMHSYRWIYRCAAKLNVVLGGRGGDEEIRDPSGWPDEILIAVPEIAVAFERIIGLDSGGWGLRAYDDAHTFLGWPERTTGYEVTVSHRFGDFRFRPFQFDQVHIDSLMHMEQQLEVVKRGGGELENKERLSPMDKAILKASELLETEWSHRTDIAKKAGYNDHSGFRASLKKLVDSGYLEHQKRHGNYRRTSKSDNGRSLP